MNRNRLREILCDHLDKVAHKLPPGAKEHIDMLREHEHGTFVAMTATIDAMEAAVEEARRE